MVAKVLSFEYAPPPPPPAPLFVCEVELPPLPPAPQHSIVIEVTPVGQVQLLLPGVVNVSWATRHTHKKSAGVPRLRPLVTSCCVRALENARRFW